MTGRCLLLLALLPLAVLVACDSDGGHSVSECPAPTAAAARQDSFRAAAVVQLTVLSKARLTDGVTTSEGLRVRVDRTLTGEATPTLVAIWSNLSFPRAQDTPDGATIIAFLNRHSRPTTISGEPIPSYDVAVANGLLRKVDDTVVRLCKGGASKPVSIESLGIL